MTATPSLLAGRYALRERIGVGGAGAVWRADDQRLGRRVAVKEVHLRTGDTTMSGKRVLREARAAARLNHPSVTAVYDVIEGEDTIHIVMELVEGPSLSDHVRADGPLTPEAAAALGLDVLAALTAAHRQGVIHRDVKPGNVLLLPDGRPKLTDFGIAAVDDDQSLTMTGTVLGSPSYMSPEQAHGQGIGPASDLWGLGALLHFTVEGEAPFDRGSSLATLSAVVTDEPSPAPHAGPLGPVIAALLQKDPADRPDPSTLRDLLAEVAAPAGPVSASAAATTVLREPGGPAPEAHGSHQLPEEPPTTRGRRSFALPLAIITVLALLLGGAAILTAGDTPDDIAEAPTAPAVETEPTTEPTLETAPDEPEPTAEPERTAEPELTEEPAEEEPAEPEPTEEPAEEPVAQTAAGFTRTTIGPAGASAAHPTGWQEVTVSGTITDYRDPGSSTYLRTDWTDSPAGDPVADWQRQSASFGANREAYQELRIEPMTVDGNDGAIWEYTYRAGGVDLRAVNVNIVTGGEAYALNIQTTAAAWDDLQPTVEAIIASFSA